MSGLFRHQQTVLKVCFATTELLETANQGKDSCFLPNVFVRRFPISPFSSLVVPSNQKSPASVCRRKREGMEEVDQPEIVDECEGKEKRQSERERNE